MKPGRKKGGQIQEELNTDSQNIDDSRVLVETWDRRAWEYEGKRESGALNVLQENIFRWWRRKFTREFSKVIISSLGTWKRVGSSQKIRGGQESMC